MDLLITEAQLNDLINEGKGGYLYYYRSPTSLLDILRTNRIRGSFNSNTFTNKSYNRGRLFFIPTTRNKSYRFLGRNCRIYLDENKLRQRYKIVPIETLLGMKEFEERVLLNKSYIVASDYVSRIDFFVSNEHKEFVGEVYRLCNEMGVPVYFFNNESAFNKGDERGSIDLKDIVKMQYKNFPPKEYEKINESDLQLFLFILSMGGDKSGIVGYLDDDVINKFSYAFRSKTLLYDTFKKIVGRMLENPDYHFLLQILADRMKRDKVENISDFFFIQESRFTIQDYISNGSKGDLKLMGTKLKSLKPLVKVGGSFDCSSSQNLYVLDSIKEVEGRCDFDKCINLKSLGTLSRVEDTLYLWGCSSLKDLGSLKVVIGDLDLRLCEKLDNLGNIQYVGGNIYLSDSGLMKDADSGELQKKYPYLADKFYF